MSIFARTMFAIAVVWTGAALPVLAEHSDRAGQQLPVPYWSPRWPDRTERSTQVLQRPTFNGEDEGTLAGAVPEPVLDIVTTAADPDLAVALTEKHLYRSRDGGETWSVLPNVPEWPTAVDLGQQTAGVVYLGTLTGGAFRSTDAGDTWQALSPDLGLLPGTFMQVTALAVNPEDEETVYVATRYWLGTTEMHFTPVGVFLSVDGGATWVQVHESELSEPMVTALKPAPGDPMTVQTATANDGYSELCAPGGVDRVAADCGP